MKLKIEFVHLLYNWSIWFIQFRVFVIGSHIIFFLVSLLRVSAKPWITRFAVRIWVRKAQKKFIKTLKKKRKRNWWCIAASFFSSHIRSHIDNDEEIVKCIVILKSKLKKQNSLFVHVFVDLVLFFFFSSTSSSVDDRLIVFTPNAPFERILPEAKHKFSTILMFWWYILIRSFSFAYLLCSTKVQWNKSIRYHRLLNRSISHRKLRKKYREIVNCVVDSN